MKRVPANNDQRVSKLNLLKANGSHYSIGEKDIFTSGFIQGAVCIAFCQNNYIIN